MPTAFRFQLIEGPVDRILGSHNTTDVRITERPAGRAGATDTHVFVNTAREFAMLVEVAGATLKLVSGDYLAVAEGDRVRALCEPVADGPLLVRDWHNLSRGIRFRTIPQPLDGALGEIAWGFALLIVAAACAFCRFHLGFGPAGVGAIAAILGAGVLATLAIRTADRLAQAHAALDRIGEDGARNQVKT